MQIFRGSISQRTIEVDYLADVGMFINSHQQEYQ